jgi:hypothetical protein
MRASILLVTVIACGGKAAAPAATPVDIMTGDPVPADAVEPASCAGGFRWLGADPHVPLAVTRDGEIVQADATCCASWGRPGEEWTEVDTWGVPVATRTIAGGEGYDVTQCYELVLDAGSRDPLLVHGDAPWTAPLSARWEPTTAERIASDRAVYFQLGGERLAAIGGRTLTIAALEADGTWQTRHTDASWSDGGGAGLDDTYGIRAVFDLDGDGFAEVIIQRSAGDSWDDAILRYDPALGSWSIVAESIGGSTA